METARFSPRPAARKVSKQAVFVFDREGKFLKEYESVTQCAEKLNIKRPSVSAALQRGSILASLYYISTSRDFEAGKFNQSRNPLAPRSQHPSGMSQRAGFLAHEFLEPSEPI
jgi:hypothetical protein